MPLNTLFLEAVKKFESVIKRTGNLLLVPVLIAFGFNTIDAMMWNFYWHDWRVFAPYVWRWTPTLEMDVWVSYFSGVVTFAVGFFLLGFTIHSHIYDTKKEHVKIE